MQSETMNQSRLQTDYWNRVAAEKRFSHPVNLEWLSRYAASGTRQPFILDYGCGYGRTLALLSAAGFEKILGIDFSAGMLARCRSELAGVRLVRNSGQGLPLKDDSIDIVILFAVLTCIPHSDQQRNQIAELRRVLQPRGLLYISDLLINDDARNRERYQRYADDYGCYGVFELPEGVVVRHHDRQWMAELTSSFEPLEFETMSVTTMNGNQSSAFQYLGRKSQEPDLGA